MVNDRKRTPNKNEKQKMVFPHVKVSERNIILKYVFDFPNLTRKLQTSAANG